MNAPRHQPERRTQLKRGIGLGVAAAICTLFLARVLLSSLLPAEAAPTRYGPPLRFAPPPVDLELPPPEQEDQAPPGPVQPSTERAAREQTVQAPLRQERAISAPPGPTQPSTEREVREQADGASPALSPERLAPDRSAPRDERPADRTMQEGPPQRQTSQNPPETERIDREQAAQGQASQIQRPREQTVQAPLPQERAAPAQPLPEQAAREQTDQAPLPQAQRAISAPQGPAQPLPEQVIPAPPGPTHPSPEQAVGAAPERPSEPAAQEQAREAPPNAAPGQAAQTSAPAKPIRIIGTVEFRSAIKNLPKWERVLAAEKTTPTFTGDFSHIPANIRPRWEKAAANLKDKPLLEQIKGVNTFFNQWPYKMDMAVWGVTDYWATPPEFMIRSGDCEDYAIAKYYALRSLGVPVERLRILVVIDSLRNIGHAVLLAYTDKDTYLLDNLTNMVLSHKKFTHYAPQYSVNEQYLWRHIKPVKK